MGFSSRKAGEQAAMKVCANSSCTVKSVPGTGADDDGKVGLRRVGLGRGQGGLDADIRFFAGLRKRGQPRQQQFIGEKRRHVQPDDGAAVADLQLFGDRFELGENIVDVLEVVRPGIGQRERAHAAFEQGDARAAPRAP